MFNNYTTSVDMFVVSMIPITLVSIINTFNTIAQVEIFFFNLVINVNVNEFKPTDISL